MTTNAFKAVIAAVMASALCACNTTLGPPESIGIRSAERYGTRVAQTLGSSSGVPCGLDRSAIVILPEPATAETQAGFDNVRTEGGYAANDPTACDRWKIHEYTGAFFFNLSDIGAVIVDSAILRFDRRPSIIPWRSATPMPDFNCQIEVRAASTAWTDPYVRGGPGTTFPVVRSSYVARRGMVADPTAVETNSLNVQGIVTYWLSNGRPNEGFVLQQRMVDGRGASHENSDSCTNIYSNATLELVVRRFVPREP